MLTLKHYQRSRASKAVCLFITIGISLFIQNSVFAQALRDHTGDKYIGSIVNINFFENPEGNPANYETILENEFNAVVAENNMKMNKILGKEPADPFNLKLSDINTTYIDQMVDWADNNIRGKMIKRGHALIWFDQAPQWLQNKASNWTNDQIYEFTKSYIQLVINYTKGNIEEWDVVNEAINVSSSGFRNGNDIWYRNVDDIQDYLEYCFIVAREADPDKTTKLFYNDFSIETYDQNTSSKNNFMRAMVKKMVDNDVPIDAVGMQSHFINDQVNDFLINNLERTVDEINEMGLICNMTELDIRICNAGNTPGQQLTKQKENYKKLVELFMSKPLTTGIVIWGFSDDHSWIPDVFNNCDFALLYSYDAANGYTKKSAYDGVLEALQNVFPNSSGLGIPNAEFTTSIDKGTVEDAVQFDASNSSDPNNKSLTYTWDFGDGNTATGANTVHTFANTGSYTIKLTVSNGTQKKTTRNRVIISPELEPQTAYVPHTIPGIIEAENYDNGGQGISYNDDGVTNIGKAYRLEQGVDIEETTDIGGGYNVGWTDDGEWLEYTIGTIQSGTYDLVFRVASGSNDTKGITAELGGQPLRSISVPNTGGWQTFQDITISGLNIQSGEKTLRLTINGGFININNVTFKGDGDTPTPITGGTITGGPFEFTVANQEEDVVSGITLSGNTGKNSQWLLTDTQNNIQALFGTLTALERYDFDQTAAGTSEIRHLSYEDDLSGATIGNNTNQLSGTFALSNPITVNKKTAVDPTIAGGTLTGGPFTFIVGDDQGDFASGITLSGNAGTNSQWVLTDNNNEIVALFQTLNALQAYDFDQTTEGQSLIWHLSYEDNLSGATIGNNTDQLNGTFELSNAITVTKKADANNGDCNFGTPAANPIPTFSNNYTHVHVIGESDMDLSNINGLNITWDLANKSIWHMGIQTNNGQPSYYVDLTRNISQTMSDAQPTITLVQTGFSGLDGSYYVAKDGDSLVFVAIDGALTIYFSQSATAPQCDNVAAKQTTRVDTIAFVSPNPATNTIAISGISNLLEGNIQLLSLTGQVLQTEQIVKGGNYTFDIQPLENGIYRFQIFNSNEVKVLKFLKQN